jgi:hypothetical protein
MRIEGKMKKCCRYTLGCSMGELKRLEGLYERIKRGDYHSCFRRGRQQKDEPISRYRFVGNTLN